VDRCHRSRQTNRGSRQREEMTRVKEKKGKEEEETVENGNIDRHCDELLRTIMNRHSGQPIKFRELARGECGPCSTNVVIDYSVGYQ
jgi:hypothetical protein